MQTSIECKTLEREAVKNIVAEMPVLNGTALTVDALHCSEELIDIVTEEKNGNIVICVKNNRKVLKRKLETVFKSQKPYIEKYHCSETGHGREEERSIELLKVCPEQVGYKNIFTIAKVTRKRKCKFKVNGKKQSSKSVFYITSIKEIGADELLDLSRSHWSIENKLHYKKDVVMNEDRYRAKKTVSRIMAAIRSLTVMILGSVKRSEKVMQRILAANPFKIVRLLVGKSLMDWQLNFLK
jgi:predicted transposase YbfD/YdcC